jgi:hypothetical protein
LSSSWRLGQAIEGPSGEERSEAGVGENRLR